MRRNDEGCVWYLVIVLSLYLIMDGVVGLARLWLECP